MPNIELTPKNRAEQLLSIITSIESYLDYLSTEKLNSLLSSLKILKNVPLIQRLITQIQNILTKFPQKCDSKIHPQSPAVCWNQDYEGKESFSTIESFHAYRKSRD